MLARNADTRPEAKYATDRYGPVFLLLVGSVGFTTFIDDSDLARAIAGVVLLVSVVGTLRATGVSPFQLRLTLATGAALAVAVVAGEATNSSGVEATVALVVAIALGFAATTLLRRIFEQPVIRVREVVAALSAYLEFAMAFAFLYMAAARVTGVAFFESGIAAGMSDFVYFSVVTITTLGYDDLTPATDLGRSLAMVETLFGQVFLVVLVAFLVGMLGRDRSRGSDA